MEWLQRWVGRLRLRAKSVTPSLIRHFPGLLIRLFRLSYSESLWGWQTIRGLPAR